MGYYFSGPQVYGCTFFFYYYYFLFWLKEELYCLVINRLKRVGYKIIGKVTSLIMAYLE